MTFPKYRKNEDLINRSNFVFPEFICILFGQGKMRVFENFILGPEKSSFCSAHFQESGKIYFINFGVRLDFLLFIFLRARPFKKKSAAPWAKGPSHQPPAGQEAIARVHQGAAASFFLFLVLVGLLSYVRLFRIYFQIFSSCFLILIYFLSPTPSKTLPSPI